MKIFEDLDPGSEFTFFFLVRLLDLSCSLDFSRKKYERRMREVEEDEENEEKSYVTKFFAGV